jgi:hypothetical protein
MKNRTSNTIPPLHAYTTLARLVNRIIDSGPEIALSYREIFDAAHERRLIPLLAANFAHIAQFTWVTEAHAADLPQMEAALHDAAAAFEGRMGTPTSPHSGLCLVIEIILEAIQAANGANIPDIPIPEPLPADDTASAAASHRAVLASGDCLLTIPSTPSPGQGGELPPAICYKLLT